MMILAVFRSRAQSLDYAGRLTTYGVRAETVSAPPETKIGCGLCVRFEERQFARANAVLRMGKYTSFKGYYKLQFLGGKTSVTPYTKR